MNLNFLIKKNHIFKKRTKLLFKPFFQNSLGLYSINKFNFEFVYLRNIRKFFKFKITTLNYNVTYFRYWIFIRPNFLLTMKSKNSRMGSGVGLFVRVCSIVKPNKPILHCWHGSISYLNNIRKFLYTKWHIRFYLTYNEK